MIRLARCNLPQATASHSANYCARSLSSKARISRSSRRTSSSAVCRACREGAGTAAAPRRIGYRIERKQGRWRVLLDRPPRGLLVPRSALAEQLLDPADRVSLLIQELSDLPQQVDVLRPIVTAATPALERLELGKFGFPETEHMRRKVEFLGNFTGGAVGGARFAGTPGGCRRVRLGHLTPRVPWPQARSASHRRPHRPDPD